MKKQLIVLAVSAMVLPAFAQETNSVPRARKEKPYQERNKGELEGQHGEPGERRRGDKYRDMSPEQKAQLQEKRLQLMEKTLKEIGVTEEQQQQIIEMQKRHKEEMKAAAAKVDEARKELSNLEKSGGSRDQIFAAIDIIAAAQADQMKLLAQGRLDMEEILGKEKFKQFMEAARMQYRKHGRRSGTGLPPLPNRGKEKPPTPPLPSS